MKATQLKLMITVCAVFLALGLTLPCMTMKPGMYGIEKALPELMPAESKSIITGIIHFFKSDNVIIGIILLLFSLVFPVWKLCVYWDASSKLEQGQKTGKYILLADKLGKFSMLDVLVLGLLVIAFQTFPGGTRIEMEWGIMFFCISVVLSILVSIRLKRLRGD